MVEATAIFTAVICVIYAIIDGIRPLSTVEPKFFRSRSSLLRIDS